MNYGQTVSILEFEVDTKNDRYILPHLFPLELQHFESRVVAHPGDVSLLVDRDRHVLS
jgi:hypothetical protein